MGVPLRCVEPENDPLTEAVVQVLNAAVSLVGVCGLCGQHDDEHTSACPVPALEDWLAAQ